MNPILVKRIDGKYEEKLDDGWLVEYAEDTDTGLWAIEIFKHDVAMWRGIDYPSLEEAQQVAHAYYDQA